MTTAQLSAVTVALTTPHDPAAFYQTRAGLCVSRHYRDRIVQKATPTQSASPVTLKRLVLERDASDKYIEAKLGANHEFTESEICWIVAEMIGKQKDGEAGDLDNTGHVNLFYTTSGFVLLFWLGDDRGWLVDSWGPGGDAWNGGGSVFSRN
jgi:hypothetical protein